MHGSFIRCIFTADLKFKIMNLSINDWVNFKAQYANNEDFNARKLYFYKMWFKNPAHNDTETQRFK